MGWRDQLEDLEKRVAYLELKADPPPPEDIRNWVAMCYDNNQSEAARAVGLSVNFIHQCMSGRRSASKKIIEKMIEDGFYGPDPMIRQKPSPTEEPDNLR